MTRKIPEYIPFTGSAEAKCVEKVVEKGWISPAGSKVEEFEQKFSQKQGSRYATAVDSGTAALHLAVESLELSKDAEIIAPSFTYGSTGLAATASRKKLKLVDIEEERMGIDLEELGKTVTDNTEAVIAVNMFGKVCKMKEIKKIADENGLKVIEDAAQALNAKKDGIKAGNFGSIGCFSFAWSKNITTGKGGMVVTDSEELTEKIDRKSNYGRKNGRYNFTEKIAYNYDMDNIRASIGLEQLKKLKEVERRKRKIFKKYSSELQNIESLEIKSIEEKDSPTVYSVFTDRRDQLKQHLEERGIGSRKLYEPLHRMPAFKTDREFPVSERLADTGLGLPSHPSLTDQEVKSVVKEVKNFFN